MFHGENSKPSSACVFRVYLVNIIFKNNVNISVEMKNEEYFYCIIIYTKSEAFLLIYS